MIERFPLLLTEGASADTASAGLKALTQPFKLRLQRASGHSGTLKEYASNVVLIEPLASVAAIEDFLWPKVRRDVSLRQQLRESGGASADGRAVDNPVPGTTIDREVTSPAAFDFYLCSHPGTKGTSTPTHYHVLQDDVGLSADELQRFTFDLCHLYARCTRIVANPAPCLYAHLGSLGSRSAGVLAQIPTVLARKAAIRR